MCSIAVLLRRNFQQVCVEISQWHGNRCQTKKSRPQASSHLQAPSGTFFANQQILCDKNVRLEVRGITPVAVLASSHRTIVGLPNFVEWNAPWHDILHQWNGKAVALAQQHGLNTWFEKCLKHHCLKGLALVFVRVRDPRH